MGTATATNDAIKYAIGDGEKLWTQAIQINKRFATPDTEKWELEHALQDGLRAIAKDTLFTLSEIAARYERTVEGPFSCTLDPDVPEDEEPRYLPLDDARTTRIGYYLRWKPRRRPLAGAVYIIRQPIEGAAFGVDGMGQALHAIVEAHRDYPQELRTHHTHYIDYLNAMHDVQPLWAGVYLGPVDRGDSRPQAHFNGIPINPQRYAPPLTLLAVYPHPGAGG